MKRLLQIFVVLSLSIIFISSIALANDTDETQLRKDLPNLLGSSNEGKEFYMTFHPCWESTGKSNGCKIYITSSVATKVTVEIPGKKILIQRTTIPNDIIEISLDPDQAQCYRKNDQQKPYPQQVFKGFGIIVTANDPIICYGMTRYESTSDGFLAYPKTVLGRKYIVSSFNDPSTDKVVQYLTSYTSIVGVYNKTYVTVTLGGRPTNYTPGADSMRTGDTHKETLNRGDVWLIGVMGDYSDLTGTIIEASQPVSVISGSFCAFVPIQVTACDFLIEQDLPMETWGYKYQVTRITRRLNASIIRVFASEPNTVIYRNGKEWSLIKSVGGEEGVGYIDKRAISKGEELRPVTISAKSRIAVTQYNPGSSDDGSDSDPFQMAVIPVEQYQKSFVFCTPGVNGGSFFRYNYLNLCYKSTVSREIPADLEFGKVSNGVINWRNLATVVSNPGQEIIDESVTDARKYYATTIVLDDPTAVYAIRCNDPMIGYIYGFDWYDSYGYPVTSGFNDLSIPDVWAPEPVYTLDCKGNVQGRVTDQPTYNEDLRSNLFDLVLNQSESYNFSDLVYDKAGFISGVTYVANWSLSVKDQEADAKAVLTFSDRSGNDTTIAIEYNRIKFSIKNKIENWGPKKVSDQPQTRSFTLVNESSNPIIVDSLFLLSTIKGRNWAYNGFKLDSSIYKQYGGVLPGYSIKAGESLQFTVTFNPSTVKDDYLAGKGQFLDSIGIKANCYWKYKSAVKAAIGTSCISMDKIDFGKVIIGDTLLQKFTISNGGNADLTITGYTLPTGDARGIYKNNLGPVSADNPIVIPFGDSKTYDLIFRPISIGDFPDKIVFESEADDTCSGNNPILEINGECINLTISQISDWYMDENTVATIPFSLNTEINEPVNFVAECDNLQLLPIDNIKVLGSGNTCLLKITPMANQTGLCNLTITAKKGTSIAQTKFKVTVSKAGVVKDNIISGNDITITPNPVNANFSINSATLIIQEVMIYDISGALVLRTDQLSNIDIRGFNAGVYYCVVKSNGNSYSKKFEIVK